MLVFKMLFKLEFSTEPEGCSLLHVMNQELKFSIANLGSNDFNSISNKDNLADADQKGLSNTNKPISSC